MRARDLTRSLGSVGTVARRGRGALLLLALCAPGCKAPISDRVQPKIFASQQEAGSGHVAVLSVAHWDESVADLQPSFVLKSEEAVRLAGPTTAVMERKLLDMLKVVARVATPSTSTTITRRSTTSTYPDEDSGRSRDVTEEESPGTAPEFTPSLPGTKSAGGLPGVGDLVTNKKELGTAALTQYALATALYQEVQLLNHYVEHATTRAGYSPYLVRLQVSLMPTVRNAPYDAYTSLSFFPSDEVLSVAAVQTGPACSTRRGLLPVVIPLLVTDDMEAALAADSAEVVRQYALALSALIRGFSVTGDVERYTDELVATATRDYNSLYSVARLTDSTIRVRMGARLQSNRNFFMVPQTHNVTLLVLVPDAWPRRSDVLLEGRTQFVNVQTGEVLPSRTRDDVAFSTRSLLNDFGLRADDEARRSLERAGAAGDFAAFRTCVAAIQRAGEQRSDVPDPRPCRACETSAQVFDHYDSRTARRLWTAFDGVTVGGQYISTAFTLPSRCPCDLPKDGLCTYGEDDGESALTVDLRPVTSVQAARLGVRLKLTKCDPSKTVCAASAGEAFSIRAADVQFLKAGQVLRCRFPSLARVRFGGGSAAKLAATWNATLEVEDRASACFDCAKGLTAAYPVSIVTVAKAPSADDPLVEVVSLPAVRACGCGRVPFTIRVKSTPLTPTGGPVKVTLSLKFVGPDGKTPASGRITKKDGTDLLSAVNEVDVLLPGRAAPADDAVVDTLLELGELENGSTLQIVGVVNKTPSPPKKVLVSVDAECLLPCGKPK